MDDIDLKVDDAALVRAICKAADDLDRPRAKTLSEELIRRVRGSHDRLPDKDARKVLECLRQQRYFDLMDRLADALIQSGIDDARVRRAYVQALIDLGSRTAAVSILSDLVTSTAEDPDEHCEALGLLGRTYKQLYVDARAPALERNRELLRKSLDSYRAAAGDRPEENSWPAINVVALLKRAKRDRVEIGGTWPSPDELASRIFDHIDGKEPPIAPWDMATALEACVALGRVQDASDWANRYVESGAEAFELGSTLRQLEEVWGLDTTTEMGAAVLPLLRDGLLHSDKGFFTVTPEEVRQPVETLERVLGSTYFQTIGWYRNGLARAQAVARIGRDTSRGDGTGFLVRGRDLHESLGDELLLLTNAHVISDRPEHKPAIPNFADAGVVFEAAAGDGGKKEYRIREVLGRSGPKEYDFALVRLDPEFSCDPPVVPYELAADLPANDGKQRVYIIGHPGGGTLSFSMQDNLLLDHDNRLLHYRAPTEGGSSGSPVFNGQWRLIGLHHAGYASVAQLNGKGGTYAANEGISIFAIREELKKQLGG